MDSVHFYRKISANKLWRSMDDNTVMVAGHPSSVNAHDDVSCKTTTFHSLGTVYGHIVGDTTYYAVVFDGVLYRGTSFGGAASRHGVKYRSGEFVRRVRKKIAAGHGLTIEPKQSEHKKKNIQLSATLAALVNWVDDMLDGPLRRAYGSRVEADPPALRKARRLLDL
jgi:hypothetical protein